jgi:hypothetical protein
MRSKGKKFKVNNSGQLLIVAALAIAILISATTVYVYELGNETSTVENESISNFILALKQSTRNAMIGSLANTSNGGEKTVLATNLNRLSEVVRSLHNFGLSQLYFNVLNNSLYDSGVWLSWNVSDYGVSSAYTNCTLTIEDIGTNVAVDYAFNITTTVTLNGYYIRLADDEKQVNLTCRVYNEEKSALAKELDIFYERLGSWIAVNSSNNLNIIDYGNGTYTISFTVNTPSSSVQVSINAYDLRDIFVRTNTTCDEV